MLLQLLQRGKSGYSVVCMYVCMYVCIYLEILKSLIHNAPQLHYEVIFFSVVCDVIL